MHRMFGILALAMAAWSAHAATAIDLSQAVIQPAPDVPEQVLKFFLKELDEHAPGHHTAVAAAEAKAPGPVISLSIAPEGLQPEGYSIAVVREGGASTVQVRGADARGLLFGVGRLIRVLKLAPDSISVEDDVAITSSPRYRIRGHQLGYRPTANTYDAWDLDTFDRYIRELILFGTNSIELIPALGERGEKTAHMPVPPRKMNAMLSELIHAYGLDVWLWAPVGEDLAQAGAAEEALERRREFYAEMKNIDAVFIPGGDGGNNPIRLLMPFLEQLAPVLHAAHPKATIWLSHQTLDADELDFLFTYIEEKKPAWLTGLVYGPWTEISIAETRMRLPAQYKLRGYPDINHNIRCENPVPNWDRSFAFTLGREACCPRPREMAYIHGIYAASSDGFVSYSDGSHDDLNKAVWSALAWDPDMPVEQIVREYSEVHFGEEIAETAAQGLLGLERNWQGPVEANEGIAKTLELWRSVNQAVGGAPQNWRLQMYTLRALYDRYVQERFIAEARYEVEALDALRQTPNVKQAVADARKALAQVDEHPPAPEIRKEIEVLGKQLFKSIGYQLSIKPPYLASNAERGAVLDYLDQPLNERSWIEARLTEIEKEDDPAKQQAMIREIVDWENPGPGGAYDDLGNIRKQPHLVRQMPIEQDPGGLCSPRVDFGEPMNRRTLELTDARLSWMDVAETLYATPLQVRYKGLDPNAEYRLRATYTGRYKASLRLTADGQYEIHPVLPQPTPVKPVEFAIPNAATADGVLDLEWRRESGRGCQVSELWLLRE